MESLNKKIVVYILDDDTDFGEFVLSTLLRDKRIVAKYFSEVELFLRSFYKEPPDLSLIDLQFGDKRDLGFELIEKIKENSLDHVVWMVSAQSKKELILHALDLGADDYLPKPVDNSFLLAKVLEFSAQKEKSKSQGLSLASFRVPTPYRELSCVLSSKVVGVHEKGVFIESLHYISRGALIKVSSSFLDHILRSVGDNLFSVEDVDFMPDGRYRLRLILESSDEKQKQIFNDYLRKEFLLRQKRNVAR